ncbi:hypothetical protein K491DRAFT_440995 [Lophiostoma macrostomum CBS 122681]|uniref:Uncharacterized protein n=1 Tax=Lophiostoma macrostomum CBS 122681 TaxID=1314788 RepID=A0A6A6T4I4_9PLEO|nr:hypothetical protein K491DRAFT_440995 [Lophiostoma macrostomum CBS 122681]
MKSYDVYQGVRLLQSGELIVRDSPYLVAYRVAVMVEEFSEPFDFRSLSIRSSSGARDGGRRGLQHQLGSTSRPNGERCRQRIVHQTGASSKSSRVWLRPMICLARSSGIVVHGRNGTKFARQIRGESSEGRGMFLLCQICLVTFFMSAVQLSSMLQPGDPFLPVNLEWLKQWPIGPELDASHVERPLAAIIRFNAEQTVLPKLAILQNVCLDLNLVDLGDFDLGRWNFNCN